MSRGFQGAVLKVLRAPEHTLEITGVREREPYTELSVHCPSLLGAQARALPPTTWVRMWIPDGEREHGWRMVDPQWPRAGQLAAVDEALGALSSATWAWVALKSGLTHLVRRHLLDVGLARRAIQCQTYWIRGRAMGMAAESSRPWPARPLRLGRGHIALLHRQGQGREVDDPLVHALATQVP